MGIDYDSVIDHPLREVWDWHTRPGACAVWSRRSSR